MTTTAKILVFIDNNIKSLRPLVNELCINQDKLAFVREEQKRIGANILKTHDWYSEDENERVLEDKYAWTLDEKTFEQYCIERYDQMKESEVIRKLIPQIDSLDYNTCLEWLFNEKVIKLSNKLLETFDAGVGTITAQEYDMTRRYEIVKSICTAVKMHCKAV